MDRPTTFHDDVERCSPRRVVDLVALFGVLELSQAAFDAFTAPVLSAGYREYRKRKRAGGYRTLTAPVRKLKTVQRRILRGFVAPLPVHDAVHGFRAGRSTVTHAAPHVDARVVVRVDLRDFFPSVTFSRVVPLFREAGYAGPVAEALALLTTAPDEHGTRRLPQGAPTSPALANAVCFGLDQRLSDLARERGFRFTRYADDLTFSAPRGGEGEPDVSGLLRDVEALVAADGFRVNVDKTHVMWDTGRQTVTGFVVNGLGVPRVSREGRRKLRAALHQLGERATVDPQELAHLRGKAARIHQAEPERGRGFLAALRVAGKEEKID